MKKILLLYHNRDRSNDVKSDEFGIRVAEKLAPSAEVISSDIDELFFEVSNDTTRIYHPTKGYDVADFDLVAFRHVSTCADEAHAITLYCEKHGIQYIDSYLNRTDSRQNERIVSALVEQSVCTTHIVWARQRTRATDARIWSKSRRKGQSRFQG